MSSEIIGVDFSGPSPEGDCLDCLVAMPMAIDKMRGSSDPSDIADAMIAHTRDAFAKVSCRDRDNLRLVAGPAQDLLYRYVATLTTLDIHTRFYAQHVVRNFFKQLSLYGVRTFYILDNTLREDRYNAMLDIFARAGVSPITPRRDGKEWGVLAHRISAALETSGHVAYIEPDSEVDHLKIAGILAKRSECVSTFRNLAPTDPRFEILASKRI